uniref:Omega-3 desaturase n=2 Tax=Chlorella TaxID=3071 RepID=A0A1L4BMI8_CHLVU|nr:omega 3 desaturase O3D-III [Chlorella sp. LKT-2007]API83166.1 omega-3 desaturase [Chlorella vulgaris]
MASTTIVSSMQQLAAGTASRRAQPLTSVRGLRPLQQSRKHTGRVANIAAPMSPPSEAAPASQPVLEGGRKRANPPPFTLADIKNANPAHCFEKDLFRSAAHLALDLGIVFGLAFVANQLNNPLVWPLYWFAQGTMFWALFCVGHDCGHQSFSNNKQLNDFVGNLVHASILVPYHGWRISHRTHHANHAHVENDESWYPTSESEYKEMGFLSKLGRLLFPMPLFAYPFYLFRRSPGKTGSHFDPECDLFVPAEAPLVETTNKFLIGQLGLLAGLTLALGPGTIFKLYVVPYWMFVVWLDVVTYLHHHGPSDENEEMPWYRREEWNYMRGGLTTIDRDYGIFSKIHHDIGTHVVHHLFPQIPHYHLCEATEAVKPVLGDYYREPEPSPGWFPTHLIKPLMRSFGKDHYVADEGNVVFYQQDPELKLSNVKKLTEKM